MINALEENDKRVLIRNFQKAIYLYPSLITNRGMWKYLMYGLLGLGHNRLDKYQKNLSGFKLN